MSTAGAHRAGGGMAGVGRVLARAVLVAGLPAAIAACGQQHAAPAAAAARAQVTRGASAAPATPVATASSPAAGASGCAGVSPASGTHGSLTLGISDNGRSLCVRKGTAVLVFLHGTAANRWSPVQASSGALAPHPGTSFTLALGVTGASFVAAHPGTVTITSTRADCGPLPQPAPTGPTTSTSRHCQAITLFRVTLVITG